MGSRLRRETVGLLGSHGHAKLLDGLALFWSAPRFAWLRGPAITEIDPPHLRGRCRLNRQAHLILSVSTPLHVNAWEFAGNRCGNTLGMWESDCGSPEGRYRIPFAASLDEEVSRRSKPSVNHVHVFAMVLGGWRRLGPQAHDAPQIRSLQTPRRAGRSRLARPPFRRVDVATGSTTPIQ